MMIRPFFTATVFVAAVDPPSLVRTETIKADAASSGFFRPQSASASAEEIVA